MIRSPSSSTTSSACALSSPDTPFEGVPRNNEGFGKSYQHYLVDQGSARSSYSTQRPRKQNDIQQLEYSVNHDWRSGSYDSSNTSWESDWSASRGGPIKSESPGTTAFYKYRSTTGSYQAGTDWSGDPPAYGGMHQSSSNSPNTSSSSYYDSNDYYAGGYGYDQNARGTPTGYQPYGSMPQQQQPYQSGPMSGAYNGIRNPSSCPPTPGKQLDYQRRQTRYGMEQAIRTQIKPDPDGVEMEGENFTSVFTKSLTSLYSQDAENAFGDDSKTFDSDIMICNSPMEDGSYQRLGPPPPGQYNTGYHNMRNNYGFYENRQPNSDVSIVQELGPGQDRTNSFRYDRPSFDDMHLYASSPPESKSQAKKRKLSMPNIAPDNMNYTGGETRRKAPRGMAFKSEAKWTPNSFGFADVQIKQEPLDDYTTDSLDASNRNIMPFKEMPTGNGASKSFGTPEHPKAPPRKRSPGSTCFDRFEKKSTPTSKKVSPLSVYAKVQDSIVLNVKCRRYKKRTKAANSKEEVIYPSKDDIENWKRNGAYSESPDQAVRHLMADLLEKVSQFGNRVVTTGPDLSQIDSSKVRELVFQFCQRYSLDYRDFEDIKSILNVTVINDKTAKNSIRASAIRKRTSVSPASQKPAPEPETKPPKTEKVVKKSTNDAPKSKPAERRVLRSLPGRIERGRQVKRGCDKLSSDKTCNDKARSDKLVVHRKRYSTRSSKEVEEIDHSDVDIIIDSSTDRESEAGKEAEVRKKSQRLKNKQPVETPAKENNKPPTRPSRAISKREETRTRSKEKKEAEKMKDIAKAAPKKKWSRLHISNENSSSSSGDSVEIIHSSSPSELLGREAKICIKIEPLPPLKSLTTIKTEQLSKSSKQSEEPANKISKSTDDTNNKCSKSAEESSNKTKEIKTLSVNISKQKDSSPSKTVSKNEELPVIKVSQRKMSQKSVSKTPKKKEHFMGRRSKTISEQQPVIKIEDESCESKHGVESSSKSSDKKLQNVSFKNNDLSSDESKDTIVVSQSELNEFKENQSNSSVNIKTSKQKVNESAVSFSSSNSMNSSSSDTSDSKRNEKPSSKSENTEKSDISKCRAQKLDTPVKHNLLIDKNEPTLQIKLNRLPLKLDSKKRFLPLESQDFYCSIIKAKDKSEPSKNNEDTEDKDSDLQDPPQLVCMKEPPKDKTDSDDKPLDDAPLPELTKLPTEEEKREAPADLISESAGLSANVKENAPKKKNYLKKACPIKRPRYSESEDSDCGLVIDLDRRMSVEERVPSPTFQNSSEKKDEDNNKSEAVDSSKKKSQGTSSLEESKSSAKNDSKWSIEDDCILIPTNEDLDCRSSRSLESTDKSFSAADADLEQVKKMKDQEESILRSLLLETADDASGSSQDILSPASCDGSDISADSKATINEDIMKFLMYQTCNGTSSNGSSSNGSSSLCAASKFDDKKFRIDKLPSEVTAQILSEECIREPRLLKRRIKKLKNEIVYLQCMIDQKDKERTAIICFKRYKEAILKRLYKELANRMHDQFKDWVKQENNSTESKSSCSSSNQGHESIAATPSTSSSHPSDSSHLQLSPARQVIQLAYQETVKTDVSTSTITNVSKPASQTNENLPTVATMIAKATENYGVDMRTIRNGTTQTILQKALSSKEATYTPTARRSPSLDRPSTSKASTSHHQQSVQIFQKTLSSTRETCFSPLRSRSPSVSESRPGISKSSTPPHPQLLHKVLSSKDMNPTPSGSSSSTQPELRQVKSSHSLSSAVQKQPLDLIVSSADKRKSPPKVFEPVPANSNNSHESRTKHSSSPKRSSNMSYSAWSSIHSRSSLSSTTTTTTIDLRADHTQISKEPTHISKRSHSSSQPSNSQGFMVVPPPTTLQQSQKSVISHHSRSDNSHSHEKSLKSTVERIYSRKTEEERRTMSFSSSVIASANSLQFSHANNSNVSIGSNQVISQPPPMPPTNTPPRCMGCGLSPAKFLCSGCRSHWYCSSECQASLPCFYNCSEGGSYRAKKEKYRKSSKAPSQITQGLRWPDHAQSCVGNIGAFKPIPGPSYS